MRRTGVSIALALSMVALLACQLNAPPPPTSDGEQDYDAGSLTRESARILIDDNVYTISGEVVADVETPSRQTAAAGTTYFGGYFGAESGGKGFVRLLVDSAVPTTDLAQPGNIVIIKTSDTKSSALLVGDVVTFRCRGQYEAVAAVRINELFDDDKVDKVATWELDYCRLLTPVITLESSP